MHSRTIPKTLTEAGGETCELSPKETILPCRNAKEFSDVLAKGMGRRVARSTNKNATSSRSHCIVALLVKRVTKLKGQASSTEGREHMARLVLVDLAGNERDSARHGAEGEKLLRHEGINVNQSLTALGKVLRMRSSAKPVPVGGASRDSALTRLLKEPLTSAKIFFIACVSPVASDSHTSALTLGYAERVKKIKTNAEDSAVLLEKGLDRFPMEFIPHDALVERRAIPRSDEGRTVYLNELRAAVLRFFVSHRWLDPAHPDKSREGHPKFKLICKCIKKMMDAGWMINLSDRLDIVDWIDFACVDQNSPNPALQLNGSMGKIIGSCDVMITPVHDPNWRGWSKAGVQENSIDPFTDYRAEPFKDYLTRGWCRLEMFFNANMPFDKERARLFDGELRNVMTQERRRPHVIFGTRELELGLEPLILPKLQDDKFNDWHPGKGELTNTKERDVIGGYVNELLQINSNLRVEVKEEMSEDDDEGGEEGKEVDENPVIGDKDLKVLRQTVLNSHMWDESVFTMEAFDLKIGKAKEAAEGIKALLCVESQSFYRRISLGVAGIEEEVKQFVEEREGSDAPEDVREVLELFNYIVYQGAGEKEYANGIRDKGRKPGTRLEHFVSDPKAIEAGLKPAHVVALRMFTTIIYKFVNNPLRDQDRKLRKDACPLPVTTWFIAEGLKKLRVDNAGSHHKGFTVWRGMRNMKVTDAFTQSGGTELAIMSATSDISVAAMYSMSSNSLLFKIVAPDFMSMGGDLQWLSAFPAERDIVYPPLTYLKPTGRVENISVKKGAQEFKFTVVEVKPVMG